MLFNSFHFVFFFVLVMSIYFILPSKYKWLLLLISSCYFYSVFVPIYLLILGFTIVIDYFAGILIEKSDGRRRKQFLILSLVANIGILFVFKYYNFLNDNITSFLHIFNYQNSLPYLSILLPIGLSFHTFQAMSYTIEVYRGNQKAERHFGIYALYVMFFPQLVAGPIERPQNLLHQFHEKHYFSYKNLVDGLKLIVWGLVKKLVIADRLAIYVNATFNNVEHHTGLTFIISTIFFAFQIYCDFSGYSDIARGTARILGFDLMINFKRPYFSKSISEFWKRWHISLSTWFKDYLYVPLGGNRVTRNRVFFNLLVVFIISGFWHGANWTYVMWGASNGVLLILAIITKDLREKIAQVLGLNKFPRIVNLFSIFITFILVCFTWIFFRSNSIDDSYLIIEKIFSLKGPFYLGGFSFFYSVLAIFILFLVEFDAEYLGDKFHVLRNSVIIKQFSYVLMILLIFLLGVFDGGQFIYFQF